MSFVPFSCGVRRDALLAMFLMLGWIASAAMAEPTTRPAMAADGDVLNFSLLDYRGNHYELRRAHARLVVLFFTGSDCPIARQNAPKLQALSEEFGTKGIAVWMVNATPQNDPSDSKLDIMFKLGGVAPRKMMGDRYVVQGMRGLVSDAVLGDRETLRQETRDYVWGTPPLPPVLRDEQQLVARYFGVKRTCDTVVIDTEKMAVVYRGAVDDQFAEGAKRPKPTANYLRDALTEYLAGKAVTTPQTTPHGCAITYDTGADDEPISYSKQIAPLLSKNCVGCHSPGNVGPFAMSSYAKVKHWSAMIEEVLMDRRMPPWHADPHYGKFANDRSLTAAESQALLRWIRQGCPRGEGDDLLAATPAPAVEWELGKPDFVVNLPRQEVPATGVLDYRYIDSDFVMPQDAWLRAAITRPGNRRVIHHIIVRVRYPAFYRDKPEEAFLFTTWVPGLKQEGLPADTGLFLPKGARFNFEVHYITNGEAQTDESAVGLYLAKEKPKMRYETRGFETRDLDIPPGEADARHSASYCFKHDTWLFGMSSHMHLRGKRMKFELLRPDGTRETLLSVPNYDFNWQTSYRLAEPKLVPAGSWLLCTGAFDNSVKNPNNPDPKARTRWGPQSWNEMFMGFVDVAEASDPGGNAKPAADRSQPADRGRGEPASNLAQEAK